MSDIIPFAEWRPDMPQLSQWAREALNVVPAEESYRPLNALNTVTNALTARAQGAAWFRGTSGVKMFAGDATKLYLLSGTTWSDVSRTVGGAYGLAADGAWRFTQFGSIAIAVNGIDVPQKFDLSVGTNWTALLGTPPLGTYITTVRDFVLMGKIGANRQRLQWSGINNAELWGTIPANQADLQDLPDGGDITGVVGGEIGVILQETAIRRMTYEGPPIIFRIDKIANDLGCSVPGSVASLLDRVFFLHKSGFYMVQAGQAITPIGRGKVDRMFWREFDEANHFRSSAAIDPVRGLYVFAYPANGSGGTPNRLLIFNWTTNAWTHAAITCEMIYGGVSQQGYTLEQLDPFGTVDTLPYPMDSSFWAGVASLLLFGFDTARKSGSFSGPTLEAVMETARFSPGKNGRRSVIRGCRPIIEGATPMVQVGTCETAQTPTVYGAEVGLTPAGLAPLYQSGRYFQVRARVPAGQGWSDALGIDDLELVLGGEQ